MEVSLSSLSGALDTERNKVDILLDHIEERGGIDHAIWLEMTMVLIQASTRGHSIEKQAKRLKDWDWMRFNIGPYRNFSATVSSLFKISHVAQEVLSHHEKDTSFAFHIPEDTLFILREQELGNRVLAQGKEIAHGGFGSIREATVHGTSYALKIPKDYDEFPIMEHGMSIMSELSPEHVPQVHYIGYEGLLLEKGEADGSSLLKDKTFRETHLESLPDWMINILDALAEAKDLDIIHGDIKPENILIVHGQAKLIDWDGATIGGSEPSFSTPNYLSPEILLKSRAQGDQSNRDSWAVGLTLLHILKGSRSYQTKSELVALYGKTPQQIKETLLADIPWEELQEPFSNWIEKTLTLQYGEAKTKQMLLTIGLSCAVSPIVEETDEVFQQRLMEEGKNQLVQQYCSNIQYALEGLLEKDPTHRLSAKEAKQWFLVDKAIPDFAKE
ncbi:MAG: hypothetical protein HY860_06200 [Chlamydiales bacterium]|nr:hypothetical protein [Chlamydiales bacterium]